VNGRIGRLDPSRTITLRRQFQSDLAKRFVKLRQAIVQLILHEDALGLKPRSILVLHAEGRWQFHSTEQKLVAFREWIKRQVQLRLIGEHLDENAWWNRYVMDGFRRGAARAFDDTRPQVREWQDSPEAKQRLDFYNGTREEFLGSSFNWPVSKEKVKLLASRTFTDLKGVTDGMAARISHTLVDGLTKGDNPRVIARELAKNVNISKTRAVVIARTEVIRTHAEGQLDAFQRMGVTHVGVMAEWLTAEDERVCPKCKSLDGVVLKVEEASGLLPRHPNCRCAWTPANVGEDESEQKRTKGSIEQAISESYGGEDSDKSSWGGADKVISKSRPKSILR
jgi:SPP1 gp7 family putative phage head morphogenesis protein